jgi:hypothetical protein
MTNTTNTSGVNSAGYVLFATIEQAYDKVGAVQGVVDPGMPTDDARPALSGLVLPGPATAVNGNSFRRSLWPMDRITLQRSLRSQATRASPVTISRC